MMIDLPEIQQVMKPSTQSTAHEDVMAEKPRTARAAAETAAKMELNLAKLKMQMAAAKLQYLRAAAAYEAASKAVKSGEDEDAAKPTGTADPRTRNPPSELKKRRSPAYWRRLKRRKKGRTEAEEAAAEARKQQAAVEESDQWAIIRFAGRRCSEVNVMKRRELKAIVQFAERRLSDCKQRRTHKRLMEELPSEVRRWDRIRLDAVAMEGRESWEIMMLKKRETMRNHQLWAEIKAAEDALHSDPDYEPAPYKWLFSVG